MITAPVVPQLFSVVPKLDDGEGLVKEDGKDVVPPAAAAAAAATTAAAEEDVCVPTTSFEPSNGPLAAIEGSVEKGNLTPEKQLKYHRHIPIVIFFGRVLRSLH